MRNLMACIYYRLHLAAAWSDIKGTGRGDLYRKLAGWFQ